MIAQSGLTIKKVGHAHPVSGKYVFSQARDGTIRGNFKSLNDLQCPAGQDYTMSGRLVNGVLSLTATWQDDGFPDNNPRPSGCAQTVSLSGNVTGPGCVQAAGSFSNSGGRSGTFQMGGACVVPIAPETTHFLKYTPDPNPDPKLSYSTQAEFQSEIDNKNGLGESFNFVGRTMGEQFPVAAADGCYFVGAPFTPTFQPPKAIIPVSDLGLPSVYDDRVGRTDAYIGAVRAGQTRFPCSSTLSQRVSIDCTSNTTPDSYIQTNPIVYTVNTRTVQYSRSGQPSNPPFPWGPPPIRLNLSAPLSPITKLKPH